MVSRVTKAEFDALIDESQELVFIDSGRLPTNLTKLVFDDAELCTPEFANLLQLLLELSGESTVYLVMLSPDPLHY